MSNNGVVKFAGGTFRVLGLIGGLIFAIGVPFVVLKYGQILGQAFSITIVIGAVIIGGIVILTTIFFGLVMPSSVGGNFVDKKDK